MDGTLVQTPQRQHDWFKHWEKECLQYFPKAKPNIPKELKSDFSKFIAEYNTILEEKGVQALYDHFGLPCDMEDFGHPVWGEYKSFKENTPVKLYNSIPEVLSKIKKETGLPFMLNTTNVYDSSMEALFKNGNIHGLFDFVFDANKLKEHAEELGVSPKTIRKPSTYTVEECCKQMNVSSDSVMHIGDTRGDLESSLGVPNRYGAPVDLLTVGVTWGFENRNDFQKGVYTDSGIRVFDEIIDTPSEILDLVRVYR